MAKHFGHYTPKTLVLQPPDSGNRNLAKVGTGSLSLVSRSTVSSLRLGGRVVMQRPAKAVDAGSIPTPASTFLPDDAVGDLTPSDGVYPKIRREWCGPGRREPSI